MNSKFVLQIRRPNYWRIELPVVSLEDQERAFAFRSILNQILQFEKTECPFQRSFAVELPERSQGHIKKKPWQPVRRPSPSPPPDAKLPRRTSPVCRTEGTALAENPATASTIVEEHSAIHASTEGQFEPKLASEGAASSNASTPTLPVQEFAVEDRRAKTQVVEGLQAEIISDSKMLSFVKRSAEPEAPKIGQRSERTLSPNIAEPIPQEQSLLHGVQRIQPLNTGIDATINDSFSSEPDLVNVIVESADPADGNTSKYAVHEGEGSGRSLMKARLRRTSGFGLARSFTAPSRLKLSAASPSQITDTSKVTSKPSPTGSMDSFHSVQSWHSAITPVLPSPTPVSEQPTTFLHPHEMIPSHHSNEQDSDATKTVMIDEPGRSWEMLSDGGSIDSHDSVATVPDITRERENPIDSSDSRKEDASSIAVETLRPSCQLRTSCPTTTLRRRALSPLPPAVTLFSPSATTEPSQQRWGRMEVVKKLPMALIAKTCEILLGPPSHLIALILKVAARIVAGEWKGRAYGYDENGEQIPVQWDYSEGDFSDWSDDDGEIHVHTRQHPQARIKASRVAKDEPCQGESRSWDAD